MLPAALAWASSLPTPNHGQSPSVWLGALSVAAALGGAGAAWLTARSTSRAARNEERDGRTAELSLIIEARRAQVTDCLDQLERAETERDEVRELADMQRRELERLHGLLRRHHIDPEERQA